MTLIPFTNIEGKEEHVRLELDNGKWMTKISSKSAVGDDEITFCAYESELHEIGMWNYIQALEAELKLLGVSK